MAAGRPVADCRLTLRRLRPLALLVLALVVPAAAPAARAPIVIANYADDGSPGTLRHAIESVAQPGDTIRFAAAARLELKTPLVVPRRLSGLTIDGATPAGGRATLFGARFRSASATLDIDADSVTLTNLTLVNLPVEFRSRTAGNDVSGPTGARVVGNELWLESTYPANLPQDLALLDRVRPAAERHRVRGPRH